MGLLIAETKVNAMVAGERTAAIRAVIAQAVPVAGTVALGLFVIALSSALLTTYKVFLVLLLLTGFISYVLRRSFIKAYATAQVALQETLAHPALERQPAKTSLPALLREADLMTVQISANSPAAGKRIRELQLRTLTGVSIVGIERAGNNILNPGPDEELQPGDHVLLLGHENQLGAAEKHLTQPK
jgi:CPA2 family monovalent cation:H+ antiporter-2